MRAQSPAPSAPTITTISSPAEVARLVPHLLGFTPHDSVVVVSFAGPRRRLGAVARFDQPREIEDIDLVLPGLEPLLRHSGGEEAMAIAFLDPSPEATPANDGVVEDEALGEAVAEEVVDATLDALGFFVAGQGLDLVAAVVVRGERWRWAGEPWRDDVLPDPVQVPAVMAYVGIGSAPLASREALADALLPLPDGPTATELRRLVAGLMEKRSRPLSWLLGAGAPAPTWPQVQAGWREDAARWVRVLGLQESADPDRPDVLAPLPELTPAELAAVVVSLEDRAFRDGLIGWLVPEAMPAPDHDVTDDPMDDVMGGPMTDPMDDVDAVLRPVLGPVLDPQDGAVAAVLRRLEELVRRLPLDLQTPVLTILAVARWADGAGAAADLAVTQALVGRPGYRLAELVDALIVNQVPPRGRGGHDRPRPATV